MNTRSTSREPFQTIQGTIKLEIYLRYRNEKDRKLFGLKDVSEYFSSKLYKYVIGVVNLETLYGLREQLREHGCFYSEYGKKSNPQTP